MDEAVYLFAALERQCQAQLLVEAASAGTSNLKKVLISDEDAQFTAATLQNWENVYVNVSLYSRAARGNSLTSRFSSSSSPSTTCWCTSVEVSS